MRRGLMKWLPEEMPVVVLEGRVARLQEAMRQARLDAVLVYTSFAQPAAVHWLTHFTPYWSEAVLVVPPQGLPVLLAALTPRVHGWIREVSHLGELVSAPKLGPAAVAWLAEHAPADARVGVVGLDTLPWSVAQAMVGAFGDERLVDASDVFRQVRQPADAAERALAVQAGHIAKAALLAAPADARNTSVLACATEMSARMAGAEEVLQRVAPNLSTGATWCRLEGELPIGEQYAAELSVAYKGVWVREGRSFSRGESPPHWAACQAWFDGLVADPSALASMLAGRLAPPQGQALRWTLEASTGLQPLTVIASNASAGLATLPGLASGTLCVLSVTLESGAGHWMRSTALEATANGLRPLD